MKIKNLLVEDGFIEELLRDLNKQEDSYVLIDYDICKELHTKTGIYRLFLMDYASTSLYFENFPNMSPDEREKNACITYCITKARNNKNKAHFLKQTIYEELFDAESSSLPLLMRIDMEFNLMRIDMEFKIKTEALEEESGKVIMPEDNVLLWKGQVFRRNDLVIKLPKEYKKERKERPGYKVLKKKDYKRNRKANILGCMSGRNYGSNKLSD